VIRQRKDYKYQLPKNFQPLNEIDASLSGNARVLKSIGTRNDPNQVDWEGLSNYVQILIHNAEVKDRRFCVEQVRKEVELWSSIFSFTLIAETIARNLEYVLLKIAEENSDNDDVLVEQPIENSINNEDAELSEVASAPATSNSIDDAWNWKPDGWGNAGRDLYLGDLYVGSVQDWEKKYLPAKPWRAWLMTTDEGDVVGRANTEIDAKEILLEAARNAFISIAREPHVL
jgi:hypothetical protein